MLVDEFGNHKDIKKINKKIVFFGASTRNQYAIENLGIQDRVLFFVDSSAGRDGTYLGDFRIRAVDALAEVKDCIVITVLIEFPNIENVLNKVREYNLECLMYSKEQFDIRDILTVNYMAGREMTDQSQAQKMILPENNPEIINSKYKYIHIFPNEKFVKPFYDMLEERLDISEHLFIIDYCVSKDIYNVFDYAKKKNLKNHNILFFDDLGKAEISESINSVFRDKRFEEILGCAYKILLHSMFFGKMLKAIIKGFSYKFGDKMAWICWGADERWHNDESVAAVVKNIRFAYAFPPRIETINKNYGIKAVPVCSFYAYVPCNEKSGITQKDENCIYILLGHSATCYGNQEYGLDLLQQWENENIKIYCPLSYGSATIKYRDYIIEKGRKIFGDKFIPLVDFMEQDQYYSLLDSMDIAVIPVTVKNAGTTLGYLMRQNKKIYLKQNVIDGFKDSGIRAYDIELLRSQSFKEFIQNDSIPVKTKFNNDSIFEEWLKVLK